MLATAKKYNLTFEAMELPITLKRSTPMWYHIGLHDCNIQWNSSWFVCHWKRHGVVTVGDLQDYINSDVPVGHEIRCNCDCVRCTNMKCDGCPNPVNCYKAAVKLLDLLPEIWDLRIPGNDQRLSE